MRYEPSVRPDVSGTPAIARRTSRRRLLGVSGAALLTAACGPTGGSASDGESGNGADAKNGSGSDGKKSGEPEVNSGGASTGEAPDGALGVNFNEDPSDMTFAQVKALSTQWVRGFVPMTHYLDTHDPAEQQAIATLLDAERNGFKTILSLKFPFRDLDQSLPKAGSKDMAVQLKRVDRVLHSVLGKVDILTVGNEPFLETKKGERDERLNAFYEHVARHVVAYRKDKFPQGGRTRLYMGALNHLDAKEGRTKATERWVRFVNDEPEIEGLDIHPHVASLRAAGLYVQYVASRLEKGKKFLATEFSLVQLWEDHMDDKIPGAYAKKYKVHPNTRVWQVIGSAFEKRFPQEQWDDFLAMSPWFASHKGYMTDQVQMFRETGKLAVATYGVSQIASMRKHWSATKKPWILNPLYANRTVETENGTVGRTSVWFDSFRALQKV